MSLSSLYASFRDSFIPSRQSQQDYIPLSSTPSEKADPGKQLDNLILQEQQQQHLQTSAEPAAPSRLAVIFTVSFHICSALSVTLLNKWALNNVPLPQVLLAFQSGICVLLSVVVKTFGIGQVGPLGIPVGELKKLWVYLAMRTIGVGMKVWCLNLVPASFYAVSRGLLLPITVLLSYYILRTKVTTSILVNIVVICIGFVLGAGSKHGGSTGSSSSSMSILADPGFILGIASTFTTALETIVVKHYGVKMSVTRAVYVTSLAGFFAFSTLSFFTGGTSEFYALVDKARAMPQTDAFLRTIILPIVISGSAYYLVSLAAVLQITVTSPVTHTISTAVRGVLQSLLAVMLLPNESLSTMAIVSIVFILAGSAGYTYMKEQSRRDAAGR